jgi:hypothetical protein
MLDMKKSKYIAGLQWYSAVFARRKKVVTPEPSIVTKAQGHTQATIYWEEPDEVVVSVFLIEQQRTLFDRRNSI